MQAIDSAVAAPGTGLGTAARASHAAVDCQRYRRTGFSPGPGLSAFGGTTTSGPTPMEINIMEGLGDFDDPKPASLDASSLTNAFVAALRQVNGFPTAGRAPRRPGMSFAERKRHMEQGLCFRCHQPGQSAKDCPIQQ